MTARRHQPHRPSARQAVARGITYELLARSFAYPDAAAVAVAAEMAELALAAETPQYIRDLAECVLEADAAGLRADYNGVFTMVTSPDCPSFESAYVCTDGGQQASVMADVSGFYEAFGLELGAHVRPDEITVELEFVGFLCRKEAFAIEHLGAPRTRQARRAQRVFVRDHLGRWGGTLGRDVGARARPQSFYARLAVAIASWIEDERETLGVSRVETVARPLMPWQVGRFDPEAGPGTVHVPPAGRSTAGGEVP